MIVQPTNLAALTWAGAAAGTLAETWRVGSVLSGRLLQQTAQGRLVLQIGGQTVEADAPSTQAPPRQFQARVLSAGAQPLLEILENGAAASPVAGALRERLPRQGGLAPLLADLETLARMPATRSLPAPVRTALAQFESAIPDQREVVDGKSLRDALARSGLQLEHNLQQSARTGLQPVALHDDLKAAAQRLVRALATLPQGASPPMDPAEAPEVAPPLRYRPLQPQARLPLPLVADGDPTHVVGRMRQRAEAALARIEITQLESHPAATPGAWLIEVPVRTDDGYDVLQLRIEHDAARPAEGEQAAAGTWTIGFALDMPALGPLQGEIRLRQARVDVRLWAQHERTVHELEAQLPALSQMLAANGLQLAQMQCRQGLPQAGAVPGPHLLEASA